jgi:transcription elongation factor Elf1
LFTCKKCKEPFHALGAEIRGQTLRVYCQCLNGHKGKREVSRYQADSMAHDLFKGLFTCVQCGSIQSLANTDMGRNEVEYTFLCPIHGEQKKRIPSHYHTAVTELQEMVNSSKSILDSLTCPRCNQVFSASEIIDRKRFLEVKFRCPSGHREQRFIPSDAVDAVMKTIVKRLLHCDECGLPCKVQDMSVKGDKARLEVACPAHGKQKKELPAAQSWLVKNISEALSEGSIVRSMLNCTNCGEPLSIKSIEIDKDRYKIKCSCPDGHSAEMMQQTDLDEEAIDAIVAGLLKCNECDLLMQIVETKIRGREVEIEMVCPVHGQMRKTMAVGVYKHLEEREPQTDREPSVEAALKCDKCSSQIWIRDSKLKDAFVELKTECRNGHGQERYFSNEAGEDVLVRVYQQLYECHKCHNPLKLVRVDEMEGKSVVVCSCDKHGESEIDIPSGHETSARDAYIAIKTLGDLRKLLETELQTQRACEYQIAPETDPEEMLDIVRNIVDQHSVSYVDESSDSKTGTEAWYYGKALSGDEFVVVGAVSMENLTVRISVASSDESKLDLLLSELRDELREVLLRIQAKSEDTAPRKISCDHCGAALAKRALPGETIVCPHCGTILHWT